ncbi:MAG: T9SS type A sorting domain-containing protein [Bacteroidota bacterium]
MVANTMPLLRNAKRFRWYIIPILVLLTLSAFQNQLQQSHAALAVPSEDFVNFESGQVHPLDMTPDGSKLLAVNTANNSLEVFEISAAGLIYRASIPVGVDPVSVRVRNNNEAWVANVISDDVSIVDLNLNAVVRTLETENEPSDIVFAGSPLKAFVSCAERESIQIFDLSDLSQAPQEVLLIGEQPRAMAVSPDGMTVYTAFFESGNQSTVINGNTSAESGLTSPQGGTTTIANDITNTNGPYGGAVPVPNNGTGFLPSLNPSLPAKTNTQSLVVRKNAANQWLDDNGGNWTNIVSGGQGIRQNGWDLKDRDVAILNANTLALTYQKHLGNILMAMAVNPTTGQLSVVGTDANNEVRFEPNLNGVFLRVNISQFTPGNSSNTISDLNPHINYSTASSPLGERQKSIGDPRGIAWKSSGNEGFVTGMGSNNVIVIDANGNRSLSQPITVGEGPTGIILDESKGLAYVLNRFSATISSIDLNTYQETGQIGFYDPTPQAIKTGRKHLYNTHLGSGHGHIACGSCHVDGKWDRLAWDLGNPAGAMDTVNGIAFHPLKGLKVTQSLVDILDKGEGTLHWRGDKQSFFDFAGAFNHLQGTDLPLDSAGMQEFEDFLRSLYHPPNPYRPFRPISDSPTIRMKNGKIRGAGTNFQTIQTSVPLFVSIQFNCSLCHLANSGRGEVAPDYLQNENIAADLRTTYRKLGFYYNSDESTSGFGMLADGVMETWFNQVGAPDYLGDYQAEVLAWAGGIDSTNSAASFQFAGVHEANDSHAALGLQHTLNGSIGTGAEVDELRDLVNEFDELGLIVKGIYQGNARGFYLTDGNNYQSDSLGQTATHAQLKNAALNSNEPLTWTIVHKQEEIREGVDRNSNGIFDRDEGFSFPVEWLEFSAIQQGEDGLLTWITAAEEGNNYFIVERSSEGKAFRPIGEREANGDTQSISSYNFTDRNILNLGTDKIRYRIKQVDLDGVFSYSKTVELPLKGEQPIVLNAYPNPVSDVLNLQLKSIDAVLIELSISNNLGQIVWRGQSQKEEDQISISTAKWARGVYYLRVEGDSYTELIKVVKN